MKKGDNAAVGQLLEAGADPTALVPEPDREEKTAVSAQSTTVLCCAAETGYVEAVRLLLDRGANPDLADSNGHPPLLRAATGGHLEIVQLLLQVRKAPSWPRSWATFSLF